MIPSPPLENPFQRPTLKHAQPLMLMNHENTPMAHHNAGPPTQDQYHHNHHFPTHHLPNPHQFYQHRRRFSAGGGPQHYHMTHVNPHHPHNIGGGGMGAGRPSLNRARMTEQEMKHERRRVLKHSAATDSVVSTDSTQSGEQEVGVWDYERLNSTIWNISEPNAVDRCESRRVPGSSRY